MRCNIDAKGKAVRLISGIVHVVIALVVLAVAAAGVLPPGWLWAAGVVGAAILAMGGFQIFEARTGWCVVRAMGIKTKF